jgi:uncharacterized damage-inducible protein DinB
MQVEKKPEVWQRGPVEGVPGLLQPVAHAILQAQEEITEAITGMPVDLLWLKPAGVAPVAFHVKHITGILDRLFTYADGQMLNQQQFEELKLENVQYENTTADELLQALNVRVTETLERLRTTKEKILKDARGVGRQQLPTTVAGLIFHAAEHTMRHTGQLLVTAKMVNYGVGKN